MITVHHFKVYDPVKDEYSVPPRKSSAERIQQVGGKIIPGTAEEVPEAALDEYGRYDPGQRAGT